MCYFVEPKGDSLPKQVCVKTSFFKINLFCDFLAVFCVSTLHGKSIKFLCLFEKDGNGKNNGNDNGSFRKW